MYREKKVIKMKDELSRIEDILQSKIDGEPQDVKSMSRIEKLLEQLNAGGGSVDPSVLEDIAKLKEQIGNANVNIEDLTNSYTKLNKSVNSLGASVVNTTNDV